MKKQTIGFFMISSLLIIIPASTVSGGIVDGLTSSATSLASETAAGYINGQIPAVFGDTDATLQCSARDIFNWDMPNLDLCKFNQKIDQVMSRIGSLSLGLGLCSISASKSLSCQADELKRMCADKLAKPASQIVSEVRNDNRNINDVGRFRTTITGGDQVAKQSLCDSMATTMSKFPEKLKAERDVTALSGSGTYGNIINSRNYLNATECYTSMLKAGKSSTDASRYCTAYSIGSRTSGATAKTIDDQSIKVATQTLKSPLIKSAANASVDEASLAKELTDTCSVFTTSAAISACATTIISTTHDLPQKEAASIAKVEEVEAGKMELFEQATAHRRSLTHPTEEYKNKLPIQQRASYAGVSKRAMAQEVLLSSYYKRISESKKELVSLMSQKKEMMSKPFYGGAEASSVLTGLASSAVTGAISSAIGY